MLDDTPDKIRRNLLVYCFTLLIGWYMGIDVKSIFSIFGVSIPVLDIFKTTLISFLILLYLTLRFSFTPEYKNGASYLELFNSVPYAAVLNYVKIAVDDYHKNGRQARRSNIFDWRGLDFEIARYRDGNAKDMKIKIEMAGLTPPGQDRVGVLDVLCSAARGDVEEVFIGRDVPRHLKYKIPRSVFHRMQAVSFWDMLVDDEKFISAKFPMILALVTYVYLLGKVLVITYERLH